MAALYGFIVARQPEKASLFEVLVPPMCLAEAWGPANEILLKAASYHRDDPSFFFALGCEHQKLGNWEDACGWFERFLLLKPDNPVGFLHLAETYLEREEPEQAMPLLEQADLLLPNRARIAGLKAWALLKLDCLSEAAAWFQRAGELDPLESDYPLNEAFVWRDLNEFQRALSAFNCAIEREPDDATLHQEAGLLCMEEDLDLAVAFFQRATRLEGKDPYNFRLLGDALRRNNESDEANGIFKTAIDMDPDDHFSYNGLGLIQEALDNVEQAIHYYRRAVELAPTEPIYQRNLGFRLMDEGMNKDALLALEHAIELDPVHALTHTMLGQLYRDTDRDEQALVHFREAVRLEPEDLAAQRELAFLLHDLCCYEEAFEIYQKLLFVKPEDPSICMNMGQALLAMERFQEAVLSFREAIRLDPECNAYLELGLTLHRTGQLEDALVSLKHALVRDPTNPYVLSGLARVYQDQGDFQQALTFHRQASELAPGFAEHQHHFAHGLVLASQYQEATLVFERSLKLDPTCASSWNGLGLALEKLERFGEAADCYRKASELAPQDPTHFTNLGNMRYKLQQNDAALSSFQQAIELDPDEAESYNGIGAVLLRTGKHEEAAEWFRGAARRKADNPHLHNLGLALFRSGSYWEASQAMERALKLCEEDSIALKTLGLIHLRWGNKPQAAELLEQAHRLDENDLEVRYGLWDLYQNGRMRYEQAYAHAIELVRCAPHVTIHRAALAQSALATLRFNECFEPSGLLLGSLETDATTRTIMIVVLVAGYVCAGRELEALVDLEAFRTPFLSSDPAKSPSVPAGLRRFLEVYDLLPSGWRKRLLAILDRVGEIEVVS